MAGGGHRAKVGVKITWKRSLDVVVNKDEEFLQQVSLNPDQCEPHPAQIM